MNAGDADARGLFPRALDCLGRNDFDGAARLARTILETTPRHAGAHRVLGIARLAGGDAVGAVRFMEAAVTLDAADVDNHANLAMALRAAGQAERAVASFDRALALSPDYVGVLVERGLTQAELGRVDAARNSFDRALQLDPRHVVALNARGNAALELGDAVCALDCFERALALWPAASWLHTNRVLALLRLGRAQDALAACDAVLKAEPSNPAAHHLRGDALQDLGCFAESIGAYDCAVALDATRASSWSNRGRSLLQIHRCEDALASYDRAIALDTGQGDKAGGGIDRVRAWVNRGVALVQLGREPEAEPCFRRALTLDPQSMDAHLNLAHVLLREGNFSQGWGEYEWRLRRDGADPRHRLAAPLWRGLESLAGRTILLYAEQGLGDTIQFCRFAGLVAARGARVVLEVQPALRTLLKSLEGADQVVAVGEALPAVDLRCPLLSLPFAFQTTLDDIPGRTPYLFADDARSRFWRDRLGAGDRLRVGLAWSGGVRPDQPPWAALNTRRNLPLHLLAPLRREGVEFYSLQKGGRAESEWAQLRESSWSGPRIVDCTRDLADFSDTAALVENLDLVITVDTSIAHLAGALGKPVWILNRFDCCWRWLRGRTDSPWYPTARIYRQARPGQWDDVVLAVASDLSRFASERAAARRTERAS